MQPTDTSSAERILADRARYVAPGMSTPMLVVAHAEGARVTDPDGRSYIDFARRHRLPEHGPSPRGGRRGDQGAGRPVPAPVLHGRRLRAVRGGVQAACRALAVRRRRAALDPRQLGRRGGRERRQDRALGNGTPSGRRVRQRVPRPDAPRDDDDEQGEAVQGGIRPVRARGLPRAGAVSVPRDLLRRLDRGARAPVQGRRRPVDGRMPGARAGAGRRRVPRDAAGLPSAAAGALPASTGSSG